MLPDPFTDYLSDPTPYTMFSVYFQNLQGTFPASPGSPLGLNFFALYFHNPVSEHPERPYLFGHPENITGTAVGAVGNPGNGGFGEDQSLDFQYLIYRSHNYGIIGCDVDPYSALDDAVWQTCPRLGLNGWIRFDWRMAWTPQDFRCLLRRGGGTKGKQPGRVTSTISLCAIASAGAAAWLGAGIREPGEDETSRCCWEAVTKPEHPKEWYVPRPVRSSRTMVPNAAAPPSRWRSTGISQSLRDPAHGRRQRRVHQRSISAGHPSPPLAAQHRDLEQ
jgi:hypothetical protein